MRTDIAPNVKAWLAAPLAPDVRRAIRRLAGAEDVRRIAIMPDVHLAGDVCIGTVLATTRLIYPAAVGGDIGCGIAAVAFDLPADSIREVNRAERTFALLRERVPIIRHARESRPELPGELFETPLSDRRLESIRRRDGVVQFGTLGRGNHFLEFQSDEDDRLWLMVHSGSRAMGQTIRDSHTERSMRRSGGLAFLDAGTDVGAAYLADAQWARRYARANRRAMVDAVAGIVRELLGGTLDEPSYFDGDHNHVEREAHDGVPLWVHRKGANNAGLGQAGIIPGSMGTESFHTEGRGNAASLCSSSHGAGRAMSRDEARRTIGHNEIRREMGETFYDDSCDLREEAPSAYKDLRAVFRAQADLVKRVRRLRPVLSYKG
ncbi:MAG TPA: RtcB family protein [Tepidisphaeraceae bacterium]|jgi:tRNA-splicing ligase RtcB